MLTKLDHLSNMDVKIQNNMKHHDSSFWTHLEIQGPTDPPPLL